MVFFHLNMKSMSLKISLTFSLVVNLTCRGCCSELGIMYISTTKKLDYKRSLFCFNVENIERYVAYCAQACALFSVSLFYNHIHF